MLNPYERPVFLEAAEAGSFTAPASRLHLAQLRIRTLETSPGVLNFLFIGVRFWKRLSRSCAFFPGFSRVVKVIMDLETRQDSSE